MKQRSDTCGSQGTLCFEYELDAPLAKVWRAVAIPEFLAHWLAARPIGPESQAPEPQGAEPFPPPPASLRILDSEPCRFVRYSWREEGSLFLDNVVTFRLRPNGAGGTTFSIVHELTRAPRALGANKAANANRPPVLLAA